MSHSPRRCSASSSLPPGRACRCAAEATIKRKLPHNHLFIKTENLDKYHFSQAYQTLTAAPPILATTALPPCLLDGCNKLQLHHAMIEFQEEKK
jgi:hypothetical protein